MSASMTMMLPPLLAVRRHPSAAAGFPQARGRLPSWVARAGGSARPVRRPRRQFPLRTDCWVVATADPEQVTTDDLLAGSRPTRGGPATLEERLDLAAGDGHVQAHGVADVPPHDPHQP